MSVFVNTPGADGAHATYCRLCEAQCGLIADVAGGRIVKVRPDPEHPVSEGHLCVKGPGMASVTYDPDRVLTPLRRKGGPGEFEPVSWEVALSDIAARLGSIIDAHGGEATGLYQGNPSYFNMLHGLYSGMFLAGLGGSKLFSLLHNDAPGKTMGLDLVHGNPAFFTFPDLERCNFLLILGANPLVSHMSCGAEPRVLHRLNAIHERDGVVVVDPRRTETAKKYEHVPIKPDGDVWLLAGMLNHIFAEVLEDRELLIAKTTGWQELREGLLAITPEIASARCGVPAGIIRGLAERLVSAKTAAVYGRVGTNRGRYPTLVNVLIETINIVTGRFGKAGGWVVGVLPISDPEHPTPHFPPYGTLRSRLGDFPLLLGYTPGGMIADEITTPGAGQLRALFITAGNPVASYPNGAATAAAFGEIELMVALDLYVTETTRHAHYILPTLTFFERADFTDFWVVNAPRPWVQFTEAVIEPLGEAWHEYDIYNGILERLGKPPLFADMATDEEPRPSLRTVVDGLLRRGVYGDRFGERPDGLSFDRLRDSYPSGYRTAEAVDPDNAWTHVHTPDGRPNLYHPVTASEISRLLSEEAVEDPHVLKLFGRRRLGSMNSWMHNVEKLVRSDRPTLLIHPADAQARGIAEGRTVRLASKTGSIDVAAEISDEVVQGSVNYPHGWGNSGGWNFAANLTGARYNDIASSRPEDWEQVSAGCHLDAIDVTVTPVG